MDKFSVDTKKSFAIEYFENGYDHRGACMSLGLEAEVGLQLKRDPDVVAEILRFQNLGVSESIVSTGYLDCYLDRLEEIAFGHVSVSRVAKDGTEYKAKSFMDKLAMEVYKERVRLHTSLNEPTAPANIRLSIINE